LPQTSGEVTHPTKLFVEEVSFLSAVGQTQRVQWQVGSQYTIQQSEVDVTARCQLNFQPDQTAAMDAAELMVLGLRAYVENNSVVLLQIGVESTKRSHSLANRLLQRTKEMIEVDFLRMNRRLRRLLQRKWDVLIVPLPHRNSG